MKHSTLMKPLMILPFNLWQHLEHMRATHGAWMQVPFSNEKDAGENHWIAFRLWVSFCIHVNPLVLMGNECSILFQLQLRFSLDTAFPLVHTIGFISIQVVCGWFRSFCFGFKGNRDALLDCNARIEIVIAIWGKDLVSPQLRKKVVYVGDGYYNVCINQCSYKWE